MTSGARVFVAVFVLTLFPLAAGAAGAATLSDPPSAVSQYIEIPPTAGGNTSGKAAPLSRVSARALSATSKSVGSALRDVATSTALGAPNTTLSLPNSARISPKDASFVGSMKEMGSSILGGGGSAIGLLAGLAVIAAAVALMARRKNSPTS